MASCVKNKLFVQKQISMILTQPCGEQSVMVLSMRHCSRQMKKILMPFSSMTMTGRFMPNMQQECCQIIYYERRQISKVVFHFELVRDKSCLDGFSWPNFEMCKNLSKAFGNRRSDLKNPRMNHLVKKTMFEFDEEHEAFELHFENIYDILDEIERARRATYGLLGARLVIFERNRGSNKAHKIFLMRTLTLHS